MGSWTPLKSSDNWGKSMFEGSKTPLNLHVEIWILQILMSPDLNFWYQPTVYILKAWKDPYGGLQNPYFLELQQKYAEGEQNCPYGKEYLAPGNIGRDKRL